MVAAMLVLGAFLSGLHLVIIEAIHNSGAAEPPQWVGYLTVKQASILIPTGLIMLWSRRRAVQRRLGAVGAAMLLVLPVVHVILTVSSIAWGGILGRGDMSYPFMYLELLSLISYAGVLVSGLAWIIDRDTPRLIGPLIITGFVLHFFVPWGMLIGYGALAIVLLRSGAVRKTRAIRSTSSVS
ncbi:hypothetical protein ACLQ2Q_17815 [Microbacterium sp. DT81.1]|uniref:hypothetical protein n=1 Tax=Microbacterium sp. DT81.1 TaxID=3393413 RepID=UPI003CE76313